MTDQEKIKVFNENRDDAQIDHPLKDHPRILALRVFVTNMPVDEAYRTRLYSSIWKYADQIVTRPIYDQSEGLTDEEALQQVTLGDMMEEHLMGLSVGESANKSSDVTFESVWNSCTLNKRLVPRDWNKLYKMLKNKRQLSNGGWEPPLPLILAAWDASTPIEKQLRFKTHIEWARDQGQMSQIGEYLNSLQENEWFHFGEV